VLDFQSLTTVSNKDQDKQLIHFNVVGCRKESRWTRKTIGMACKVFQYSL